VTIGKWVLGRLRVKFLLPFELVIVISPNFYVLNMEKSGIFDDVILVITLVRVVMCQCRPAYGPTFLLLFLVNCNFQTIRVKHLKIYLKLHNRNV